tara:strand:+ start:921 stop:1565 length:645 start_codon:yes stop_codon:yes gene_type:complete
LYNIEISTPPIKLIKMKPTTPEIEAWLLGTIRHVQHIEYFLERLQIGKEDPQRPHDIIGNGNKFEWDVIRGFALQYRDRSTEFFDLYVAPSLERHRCQYHHQKWNNPNTNATDDDMKVGAVDAVCSLLESDRAYQGGKHTPAQIEEIIEKNLEHKRPWLRLIHTEIQRIEQPNLQIIRDLKEFLNIGINPDSYDILRARVNDTIKMLQEHGYKL